MAKFQAWSNTELAGCNDLVDHDNTRWFELGGQDIVCWGNDVKIFGTQEAAEYIAGFYGWENLEQLED